MFEKYLQDIGLTDKEATIYLYLLSVDHSAVLDVAKKTKINRSTVYFTLEWLMKKGLVSETQIGKKVHYQAEPPERLETYVERQKLQLEEQSRRLQDIIPQIKSVERKSGERPVVKFFNGRDGAISAYEEFYETHNKEVKDGHFIFNVDLIKKVFTEKERDAFRKIRIGNNVSPASLYVNNSGDHQFPTVGNRIRLDGSKYPITCDISIIDDRIIITTLGEQVTSILIKSKDIADTLVSLVKKIIEK